VSYWFLESEPVCDGKNSTSLGKFKLLLFHITEKARFNSNVERLPSSALLTLFSSPPVQEACLSLQRSGAFLSFVLGRIFIP
jgi:hypothetical protein